ncbi:MAG: hypothetical protein Q9216_005758 [Gyalolechia sp. 2 TL-2023]
MTAFRLAKGIESHGLRQAAPHLKAKRRNYHTNATGLQWHEAAASTTRMGLDAYSTSITSSTGMSIGGKAPRRGCKLPIKRGPIRSANVIYQRHKIKPAATKPSYEGCIQPYVNSFFHLQNISAESLDQEDAPSVTDSRCSSLTDQDFHVSPTTDPYATKHLEYATDSTILGDPVDDTKPEFEPSMRQLRHGDTQRCLDDQIWDLEDVCFTMTASHTQAKGWPEYSSTDIDLEGSQDETKVEDLPTGLVIVYRWKADICLSLVDASALLAIKNGVD